MTSEPPDLRASDAERERTVLALRDAAAEGRLTLEELAGRLDRALTATTRGELESLTADLPAAPPPAEAAASRAPARARGTRWIVGIMGGGDRKGRWRIARRCTVINIMGGADLDLRDALIEGPEVDITVISIMGGSDIIVPERIEVELGGFALMGSNDLKLPGDAPPLGAPLVRVRAFSLMGGTDVKTKTSARAELASVHGARASASQVRHHGEP
jgi:Domain of unknown function (DUF1707)/Cell wall-active antibiotics response 4TMS YvqF